MTDSKWTVEGRRFRTKVDYDAALRDKKKIDILRKKYDFKNKNQVLELLEMLEKEQFQFESQLGKDFDDEVYELSEQLKKQKDEIGNGTQKSKKKIKKETSVSYKDCDETLKKEILVQLEKREKRRKRIVLLCGMIAVVCLGYVGIYSFFTARTTNTANALADLKNKAPISGSIVNKTGNQETPDILDEYKNLYNKNKSLIGWVKIADTNIDYPVMQSANSEYYLDHNFDQAYDKNGSIFLDTECDVLKPSTNFIVYGHHMKSGKMFGDLDKYSNQKYYEDHKIIEFDTIYEKGTYEVMYVFRSRIFYEDEIVFKYYQFIDANSAEEFDYNMEEMSKVSIYDTGVKASYGEQLLTLSTCDNSEEAGRFVVVAKRIS